MSRHQGDIYRGIRGYTVQRGGPGAIRNRLRRMFPRRKAISLGRMVPGSSQLMIHGRRRDTGGGNLMMLFNRSAPLNWYRLIRQVRT